MTPPPLFQQDLNQDGISQEGELKTLDELDITSLTAAKSEHSRILANGNDTLTGGIERWGEAANEGVFEARRAV